VLLGCCAAALLRCCALAAVLLCGMRAVSYEPAPAPAPAKASLPLQPPAVLFNDDCPICLDR
jgi:hypothetical protein